MNILSEITSILLTVTIFAVCIILPLVLTVWNLYNLFAKTPFHELAVDRCTFLLGPLLMWFLWKCWSAPDWDVALYNHWEPYFHSPLASWHMPTMIALSIWALLSFWVLRIWGDRLPPLPTVLCISGLEIGIVLAVIFMIQLSPHLVEGVWIPFDVFYMLLFPLNYLISVPRLLRQVIQKQMTRLEDAPPAPNKRFIRFCHRFLSRSLGWVLVGFVLALPLLGVLLGLLILCGQAPDAAVRAFTETSDWALSQKISPPPIEFDGHYLCTVAVGGHPKLVKPTRYGVRHGKRIVVNRQLCVANAFEQLIMERTPRLHRAVRQFYDTHGYPLSQKLTTPFRADVTYLLMKPLEWFFLLCLYSFDARPENRIAMQYTGR